MSRYIERIVVSTEAIDESTTEPFNSIDAGTPDEYCPDSGDDQDGDADDFEQ